MDKPWDYFFSCRTSSGLVLDRESNQQLVSIAATGFGMACWALAAERGFIPHSQAVDYVHHTLDTVFGNAAVEHGGWLYHFMQSDGSPHPGSEISTVDSALFYLGAQFAARQLGDSILTARVDDLIDRVHLDGMLSGGYFHHGRYHDGSLIPVTWDCYSEGVLVYKLFNCPYEPPCVSFDLPLFVYYYPLCFFADETMLGHLRIAVQCQQKANGYWGLTACDGPHGYQVNEPHIVSPLQVEAVAKLLGLSYELPVRGVCGYDLRTGWVSNDRVGIDVGSCLVLDSVSKAV